MLPFFMTKQDQLNTYLKSKYPDVKTTLGGNAISSFHIELPQSVLDQAQKIVQAFFRLRNHPNYQLFVRSQTPDLEIKKNFSILMSYDFHLTADGLKLIEINTNASSSLLFTHLYEMQGFASAAWGGSFLTEIKSTFETELNFLQSVTTPQACIIDEKPLEQKMYIEFELYKSLLKSWGWGCEIQDIDLLREPQNFHFIYNRSTDFYFEKHPALKKLYEESNICFSPNPHEYALLADKQRMIDMSIENHHHAWGTPPADRDLILQTLPKCFDSATTEMEELWTKRKNLFFKPKSAYGGKMAYRGSSISRKTFETMKPGEFLAQEYIPAPELSNGDDFKFDLRFYAYQDRIQLVGARVFKGQLTNFREVGSGIATVEFKQ